MYIYFFHILCYRYIDRDLSISREAPERPRHFEAIKTRSATYTRRQKCLAT